jgi:hypothetical protein
MKSVKEIEKLPLEDLIEVASNETIKVPEGLYDRLAQDVDREVSGNRWFKIAGAAAIVILVVGLGLLKFENEPKDTFSDPYLAYAEREKAFEMVSEGMQKGIGRTVEFLK